MAELSEQQEQITGEVIKVKKSRSGLWFGIIVLIIIISIAGAGFFLFQQLRSQQENLGGELDKGDMQLLEVSKQISGYQSQLAAIQSQLATLEADSAGKNEHFNKTLADFSQLHSEKLDSARKELSDSISQVQRQLGKTRGDWLIADAEYLLTVANQRLYLSGDISTTRAALEAADQRLRESGDAGGFKVREQIAKEIAALSNITVIDTVGIYGTIQSLEDRVNGLVLFLPYSGRALTEPTAATEAAKKEPAADKETSGLVDSALEQLEDIVTIRHTEQPIKEILTPQQAEFIREQLRVKLEMVKLALVQQNQALYQAGLADAKKWAEHNFATNADTSAFIAELDRLNTVNMHNQYPDISLSLKLLKDITKLRIEADKASLINEPVSPAPSTPAIAAPPVVNTEKAPDAEKPVEAPKPEPAKKSKK
ncbi:MAG: uroporphyrinogen-III C-methyltransferase [Methylococcaceae bacterium]|nr:uroporphyrinogen-III C-methyltransferase [Methylococcaceae bacterium]MDP2391999.1 uroporphyrinogen-III C-methyltransferase [Methylococcaceae bacterium]MDP3020902.1 uroporphyrinogen-III C-methyltransferase [Methylococcaceae bacterium]MDP3391116.1 uroporphyrinogen-III C-methyltransferase [Methylococcaceae bacterium]MDP3932909.1 uroporphyrinogen-III C-methyltransferase [Methylococcaceae bacterium]